MIPLTITTPEQAALWTQERRQQAFLLDLTGKTVTEEGWAQSELLKSESRGFSGGSLKNTTFMASSVSGTDTQSHGVSCACCVERPALISRLLALVQERARGRCTFFRHIALVVSPGQQHAVAEGLKTSQFVGNLLSPDVER